MQRYERVDVVGEAAQQRRRGEGDDRAEEDPAVPIPVAELAAHRQHQHEPEHVGGEALFGPTDTA